MIKATIHTNIPEIVLVSSCLKIIIHRASFTLQSMIWVTYHMVTLCMTQRRVVHPGVMQVTHYNGDWKTVALDQLQHWLHGLGNSLPFLEPHFSCLQNGHALFFFHRLVRNKGIGANQSCTTKQMDVIFCDNQEPVISSYYPIAY